jgi:YfiH family protein
MQLGTRVDWPVPANVRARVSQRSGGVSVGRYASLNVGTNVGDDVKHVIENRRRLARDWRLPGEPVWLEQVHGTTIADLDSAWSGPADGAVTSGPGTVCAILTADCLPVLLADSDGTRVGAAHGGWRGLAAGILPALIAAMQRPPGELLAWLGPCIGVGAYEVGDEVREALAERDPGRRSAFVPNERGRWQANLCTIARRSLTTAGVTQIYGGGSCTYRESASYFSHRREAPCGRMASMIWLEPS